MTDTLVVLHSAFGATPGFREVTDALAVGGRRVIAPDYYEGHAFTGDDGIAYRDSVGASALLARVREHLADVPDDAAFVGFSLGAAFAQRLVLDRPAAPGLVLVGHVSPLRGAWPGVPVQVHRFAEDDWTNPDDVDALRGAVSDSGATFEDVVTPGSGHLFTEHHASEYDPALVEQFVARVGEFLGRR